MAERTIKHVLFTYMVEGADPIRPESTIRYEKVAHRGETVDIPFDFDIERGERHGAFVTDAEQAAASAQAEEAAVSEMSDEELISWIQEDKPKVNEVIDAAEGDPVQASRLLEAEDKATGGDSRKGVIEGLTAVVGQGQ